MSCGELRELTTDIKLYKDAADALGHLEELVRSNADAVQSGIKELDAKCVTTSTKQKCIVATILQSEL